VEHSRAHLLPGLHDQPGGGRRRGILSTDKVERKGCVFRRQLFLDLPSGHAQARSGRRGYREAAVARRTRMARGEPL